MPSSSSVSKNSQKYKLFSTSINSSGDQPPPCAFFLSDKGCRNGDSCKFAHGQPQEQQKMITVPTVLSDEQVISSESESSETPNDAAASAPTGASAVVKEEVSSPFATASQLQQKKKGKKTKRGHENPFANPKLAKQQKMATETTTTTTTTTAKASMVVPPQNTKKESKPPKKQSLSPSSSAPPSSQAPLDFLQSLNLPIAAYTPATQPAKNETKKDEETSNKQLIRKKEEHGKKNVKVLPTSTEVGRKWLEVVQTTQSHPRYASSYDFSRYKALDENIGYASNTWVETEPFEPSKASHPQAIAIDCEMCETRDPVSGEKDPRALCRISVVDVETDQVLLDTLVKPMWPVTDYRTWVNGISAQHLEPVQFTLRHAQAFLRALCSQETVILGHSVQNDLASLRMDHPTVVDSAFLYKSTDAERSTVSLKDLASCILKKSMPELHDSVNDARVAYQCIEHYRKQKGQVEAIPRSANNNRRTADEYASRLFVHRIPKNAFDESQLGQMFLSHTSIQPVEVEEIDFSGNTGKTQVIFKSGRHGHLAFDSLEGKPVPDASGRLQKKVFLRNGDYVRIRKMAYEQRKSSSTDDENKNKDNRTDAGNNKKRRQSS